MLILYHANVGVVTWSSWFPDPIIILGVLAAGFAYLRLAGPWRARFRDSAPIPTARVISFVAALACLVAALLSPLEPLSDDYLLSAHMVQHLLLVLAFPPLFYYGLPEWFVAACARTGRPWRVWRRLTHPAIAFVAFQFPFACAHAPIFYDATLRFLPLHIAEHLVFLGTAMLAWWPTMAPKQEYGKLPPALELVYLFGSTLPGQIVGALLTMASAPIYDKYAAAPRIWGISALADQQFGGLLMWIGTGVVYLGVMAVIFFRWAGAEDRAEQQRFAAARPSAQLAADAATPGPPPA